MRLSQVRNFIFVIYAWRCKPIVGLGISPKIDYECDLLIVNNSHGKPISFKRNEKKDARFFEHHKIHIWVKKNNRMHMI